MVELTAEWVLVWAAVVFILWIAASGEVGQIGAVAGAAVDAKAGVFDQTRVAGPATVLVSVEVVAARDVAGVHFLALGPVARAIADGVGVYVAHGGDVDIIMAERGMDVVGTNEDG